MAEFVDVIKKRKEMCDYYEDRCAGCPIDIIKKKYNIYCADVLRCYPEEIEEAIMSWEKPVDWSNVEVDTKILVKNFKNDNWNKRYFAKFENGKVYAWKNGTTSFTADNDKYITDWNLAKLAEEGEAR